ncbi:hypothetical protein, partial [Corynebacterium variabile]|uniref:hypothetical protein n=1 Tax=Corynebacterium variabile TaxID=1727 RepID=UPI0028AC7A79
MNKHFWPGLQGPGHRLVQQQRSDYPSMTAECRALGDVNRPGFNGGNGIAKEQPHALEVHTRTES